VANRILGGLGKEHQGVKYGLRARPGDLKVENFLKLPSSMASASITARGMQAAASYQVAAPSLIRVHAHFMPDNCPSCHTICQGGQPTSLPVVQIEYHNPASGPQRTNTLQAFTVYILRQVSLGLIL